MKKIKQFFVSKFVQPFKENAKNKYFTARSVMWGMIVGWNPLLGFQTAIMFGCLAIAKGIRQNFSMAMAWVVSNFSNALTMPFLYLIMYKVGAKFVEVEKDYTTEEIGQRIGEISSLSFPENIYGMVQFIFVEMGGPIFIGYTIIAAVSAFVGYGLTLVIYDMVTKNGNDTES